MVHLLFIALFVELSICSCHLTLCCVLFREVHRQIGSGGMTTELESSSQLFRGLRFYFHQLAWDDDKRSVFSYGIQVRAV